MWRGLFAARLEQLNAANGHLCTASLDVDHDFAGLVGLSLTISGYYDASECSESVHALLNVFDSNDITRNVRGADILNAVRKRSHQGTHNIHEGAHDKARKMLDTVSTLGKPSAAQLEQASDAIESLSEVGAESQQGSMGLLLRARDSNMNDLRILSLHDLNDVLRSILFPAPGDMKKLSKLTQEDLDEGMTEPLWDQIEYLSWEGLAMGGLERDDVSDIVNMLVAKIARPMHQPHTSFSKASSVAVMPKENILLEHLIPIQEKPEDASEAVVLRFVKSSPVASNFHVSNPAGFLKLIPETVVKLKDLESKPEYNGLDAVIEAEPT